MHQAADGPLARVRVPGGLISTAQLTLLATGVLELTSRANVQVRGVRSPASFASALAGAGLLPSASHERVRNIVASPLGGRGVSGRWDTQPLVEALDQALCARDRLASLPGRFLFAVDDGTGDMLGLGADVTLTPDGLVVADSLLVKGATDPLSAAEAFLDERDSEWRITELPNGPARIAARLGIPGTLVTSQPPRQQRAGLLEQRDGRVALEVVPPLGRLSPAHVRALADTTDHVRLTPWRTVVLVDLPPEEAAHVAAHLEAAGLVTDPSSPWVGVTACTGSPGCAKSLADVQQDAARWTPTRPTTTPVHWSGCERRCGLPKGQVTQLIATADGYQERQQ
ncbi:precorrin-3B synthase [Nonomuraea sp. NPDC050556]|uniref:precorrin-3B synthase n=1 Tax=Nonomuraea sp. NPDC050556 TaxID=3364369 RepID=UPI0037B861A3